MLLEVPQDVLIISKTDTKGRITYANELFVEFAQYSEVELLGSPHSIIRHEDMPKAIFKIIWQQIKNKEEAFALVINKTKKADSYWVYTNVTPSLDNNGNIIGYFSVRVRPSLEAIEKVKPIYKKMLEIEATQSVEESLQYLLDICAQQGVTYNEFIISL